MRNKFNYGNIVRIKLFQKGSKNELGKVQKVLPDGRVWVDTIHMPARGTVSDYFRADELELEEAKPMSADNGIYILKTLAQEATGEESARYEYRVVHAQAIENIYWNAETGGEEADFQDLPVNQYFGRCRVYLDDKEAWEVARQMADEVLNNDMCPILEYGISMLEHPHQVFRPMSEEEMRKAGERRDELMEKHRAEYRAGLEARRKKATILFGEGVDFEPTAIYGYYIKPDGSKVHGSLSGVNYLIVRQELPGNQEQPREATIAGEGTNLQFLSSDWNEEREE